MRLLRAGFSPRHVHRYVGELRDHLTDLQERESASGLPPAEAEARALSILGSEDDLYQAMVDRRAPRSRVARAPWVFFGLLPIATLFIAFVVSASGTVALLSPYQALAGADIPPLVRAASEAISLFTNFLLAPALAAACIVIALRQRLASPWVWVGLMSISVAAAPLGIQIEFLATGVRGSAAHVVHRGGDIDAAATLSWIALRGAAFFFVSAVTYRLLQLRLLRLDAHA